MESWVVVMNVAVVGGEGNVRRAPARDAACESACAVNCPGVGLITTFGQLTSHLPHNYTLVAVRSVHRGRLIEVAP